MLVAAGSGPTARRARRLAPSCCAGRFLRMGGQSDPHRMIPAVKNILPPADVVAIPADGLHKSGLERLSRVPPKLSLDFTGIDGIAVIVAGSVSDVSDQPPPAP